MSPHSGNKKNGFLRLLSHLREHTTLHIWSNGTTDFVSSLSTLIFVSTGYSITRFCLVEPKFVGYKCVDSRDRRIVG